MIGPYWCVYWSLIFCNGIVPQSLWFKRVRTNIPLLFVISLIVNVGMWLERFVIVVTSLHRDFLPSSWGMYAGTIWDWTTYIGTIGLFAWLHVPLRPLPADDLDLRDAHDRAGGEGGRAGGALRNAMAHIETARAPFGLMAEFDNADRARRGGTPRPRGGLHEDRRLLAVPDRGADRGAAAAAQPRAAAWSCSAGMTGALAGYGLEYWSSVIAYPLNIGGRPFHSMAVVHRAGVRDDDPVRGARRRSSG